MWDFTANSKIDSQCHVMTCENLLIDCFIALSATANYTSTDYFALAE